MCVEKINIALITDKNYFVAALVTIKSLLANTTTPVELRCVLTEDVGMDVEEISSNLKKEYPKSKVEFIYFDDSVLADVQTKFHISRAAYVKIYLPDILSDWNKCIFLDSDLLVKKDIKLLWSFAIDMKNKDEIAAVWNPGYIKDNEVIGVPNSEKTFNSGVMIMNLEIMRKNNSSQKLKEFINEFNKQTHLNDQPAFNAIYKKKWIELPLEWNTQFQFYLKSSKQIGISKKELKKIKSNPGIIHFTTSSKPWKYRSIHPYKKEYLTYLNEIDKTFYQGDITFLDSLKLIREFVLLKINQLPLILHG